MQAWLLIAPTLFLPLLNSTRTAGDGLEWASVAVQTAEKAEGPQKVDFVRDIRPLFEEHCLSCHGESKQKGGLRFDRREGLFEGEEELVPIVPKEPDASYLLTLVSLDPDDPDIMPAKGAPLSTAQVALLRRWIEEGAEWVDSAPAPVVEALVLPELSEAQRVAVDAAAARLRELGARVATVSADSQAMEVSFALLREKAGKEAVAALAGLEPVLVHADFSRTAVEDAALEGLAGCTELRHLNLSQTKVTAGGLVALKGLKHLEYLNLYGSAVGDEALETLAGLGSLRHLYLWQAPISDEAVARLSERCPELKIVRGQSLVVPAAIVAVNAKCPVSGQPIDAAQYSTVQNQRVGFCCAKCKASFDAKPEDYLKAIEGFVPSESDESIKKPDDASKN